MKTLITTTLLLSSLSAFAKVQLTCVADDFSPVGIEVVSTGSKLEVITYVNRVALPTLSAEGTITPDSVSLKLGTAGGSLKSEGGAGGIYGVLPVSIPEYNIHNVRMTCFAD